VVHVGLGAVHNDGDPRVTQAGDVAAGVVLLVVVGDDTDRDAAPVGGQDFFGDAVVGQREHADVDALAGVAQAALDRLQALGAGAEAGFLDNLRARQALGVEAADDAFQPFQQRQLQGIGKAFPDQIEGMVAQAAQVLVAQRGGIQGGDQFGPA
jgi:hypothetical protein